MDGGIIFIDKEAGMTSRKVDNILGHLFKTHKVGHLGTLDPFATGLLICGVNSGNKCMRFALDEEKTYIATLVLGNKTSTGDKEGEVIETKDVPLLEEEAVRKAVEELVNEKSQIPPMTSAIKVDGTALYKLAHKGEEITRQPRPIAVYSSKLLSFEGNQIVFEVNVSKGTYIRTLGETLAEHLGTVGHLIALRRTAIGEIKVESAIPLDQVNQDSLRSPLTILNHMEQVEIGDDLYKKVVNGVKIPFRDKGDLLLLTKEGEALAVYEETEQKGLYRCLRGLTS